MASERILEEKKQIVKEISDKIKSSEAVILFQYQGLTVSELEELRGICDRIAIVSGGTVSGILPANKSSEEFGELMVSKVI